MILNLTEPEARALAAGEVPDAVRVKAEQALAPAPPQVHEGQTTIDEQLEAGACLAPR